jgi:hypothetical protein
MKNVGYEQVCCFLDRYPEQMDQPGSFMRPVRSRKLDSEARLSGLTLSQDKFSEPSTQIYILTSFCIVSLFVLF